MAQGIATVESKWGTLEKDYFVEALECNREEEGYYDGCGLYSPHLYGKQYIAIVAYDGTISYR